MPCKREVGCPSFDDGKAMLGPEQVEPPCPELPVLVRDEVGVSNDHDLEIRCLAQDGAWRRPRGKRAPDGLDHDFRMPLLQPDDLAVREADLTMGFVPCGGSIDANRRETRRTL